MSGNSRELRKLQPGDQTLAEPARRPATRRRSEARVQAPARFMVHARADAETLPRLANYVAALGLIPSRVQASNRDGVMTVIIEQGDIDDRRAGIVAEKMRSSVLVDQVRVTRGRRLLSPLSGAPL